MDIVTGVGVLDKSVIVIDAVGGRRRHRSPTCRRRAGCPARPHTGCSRRSSSTAWCVVTTRGRYLLGLGLVALGHRAAEQFPLAERALPCSPICATRPVRACSCSCASRRAPLRRLAPVAARPALDRARRGVLPNDVGSAGRVLGGDGRSGRMDRERRGARAGRGVGERAGARPIGDDRGGGERQRTGRAADPAARRPVRRGRGGRGGIRLAAHRFELVNTVRSWGAHCSRDAHVR